MKSRQTIIQTRKELRQMEQSKQLLKKLQTGMVLFSAGAIASHLAPQDYRTGTVVEAQSVKSKFLSMVTDYARDIASENDLYASVMIAQAALESGWGNSRLAQAPNYNLFGIKGNYQGQSVLMPTLEDDGSGNYYQIKDGFRRYNNYGESLRDYASVLTGNHDPSNWRYNFYAGARRSNTNSYQEATAHLTGRYATDTSYASKLNRIIEENNLTQFDQVRRDLNASNPAPASPARVVETESLNQPLPASQATQTYIVNPGDSLWAISRKYGMTVDQLKQLNGFDSNNLLAGQTIQVAQTPTAPEAPARPTVAPSSQSQEDAAGPVETSQAQPALTTNQVDYVIQPGDTLYAIAKRNGLSLDRLMSENKLQSSTIYPGQELKISRPVQESKSVASTARLTAPAKSATNQSASQVATPAAKPVAKASQSTYSVSRGDTLYAIANRNGIQLDQLMQANQLNSSLIYPGQTLTIPSAQTETTSQIPDTQEASVETSYQAAAPAAEPVEVPAPAPLNSEAAVATESASSYKVQAGDTLYSIAKANQLDVEQLIANNQGSTTILIGQEIQF
ncbi:LysM peptidoglycan-binding domain-containing protein [Hutsoniella sourekii]|uniref:LysM peptidoglycan-binding domain-containing protein n=1 Tax=Hutsoniella sourekii TaxID=87650 RepID=UPI0012EE5128|nr:LysM peptidoglycan-binding domain-containing protein [Hutsoniella sourekii]